MAISSYNDLKISQVDMLTGLREGQKSPYVLENSKTKDQFLGVVLGLSGTYT